MGGGKEKKATNQLLESQNRQINREHAAEYASLGSSRAENAAHDQQYRGSQDARIDSFGGGGSDVSAGGFGVDSSKHSVNSGGYGMDAGKYTGMVDPTAYRTNYDFGESKEGYRNFMDTAGVDENRMRTSHGTFDDIQNNPAIAARMRGGGVFDEFAQTGGYTEADKGNIRARAVSPIRSMYSGIQDEGNRAAVIQGGYGPGREAMKARLARDASRAIGDTSLSAELGIKDRVNEGRQWGSANMTGSETGYQGLRFGAAGAKDASEANIQGTLQGGRMFGTQGMFNAASREAEIEQNDNALAAALAQGNQSLAAQIDMEGNRLRSGIDVGNADRGANIDVGNADRGANISIGNANRGLSRDIAGAGMAQDRFNANRDYNLQLGNQAVQNRALTYGAQNQMLGNRMQNNPQRDWFATAAGLIGSVSGGVSAYGNMKR